MFTCDYVKTLWSKFNITFNIINNNPEIDEFIAKGMCSFVSTPNQIEKKKYMIKIIAILWNAWKERNRRSHSNQAVQPNTLCFLISSDITCWSNVFL